MQYYRCKCGKCEAWGSMPPYACSGRSECGTDLAMSPGLHRTPKPHDFSYVEKVQTDQGEMTRTRCRFCHRTKQELEREAAAEAAEALVQRAHETVKPQIERETQLENEKPCNITLD